MWFFLVFDGFCLSVPMTVCGCVYVETWTGCGVQISKSNIEPDKKTKHDMAHSLKFAELTQADMSSTHDAEMVSDSDDD